MSIKLFLRVYDKDGSFLDSSVVPLDDIPDVVRGYRDNYPGCFIMCGYRSTDQVAVL